MDKITVGIAEGRIAFGGQMLVTYALGSCVGICLYDSKIKIAGLAHIVLPDENSATVKSNPYKFAKSGIPALIMEMQKHGADKKRMTAKIAGGAKMFHTGGLEWDIGEKNTVAVRQTLRMAGIRIVAEDTGANYGRTLEFCADDGTVQVKTVRKKTVNL